MLVALVCLLVWVGYRSWGDHNVEVVAKLDNLLPFQLKVIINYDFIRYSKSTDNIFPQELSTLLYVILATTSASTHFVKYSQATMTNFFLALANENSPNISKPH